MRKAVFFNNIIDTIFFIYIFSLYFFTYRPQLNLISNGLAFLLVFLIWIYVLSSKRKIFINKFIIIYALFVLLCFISVAFAINQQTSMLKVQTLILIFIMLFSIINYFDSIIKIKRIMKFFVISGLLSSLYILVTSDLSQVTRFGGELGNVNAIGLIIGISSVFCFFFILEEKKKILYIFSFIVMYIVILLTGSRKAIILVIFSVLIISTSKVRNNFKSIFKFLLFIVVLISLVTYLIFNVPFFYQIIGYRLENLLLFSSGYNVREYSIIERSHMINFGENLILERPLFGYGIDNFRHLYSSFSGGRFTYSHNNFVEIMVGTGILGMIVYYFSHFMILKDLYKVSKNEEFKSLAFAFGSIITSYIILSIGLVYYSNKHFSIILAIGSIIYRSIIKEGRKR